MSAAMRRLLLAAGLLAGLGTAVLAHEPGGDNQLPGGGTAHELRITSLTSLTVAQQITQPAVCSNAAVCLQNELHLPVVIDFGTGQIAIDATAPTDESSNPVPPGGPGGVLFQTQAGPAELRFAPPCENPDGCVGGTPIYIGTIDDAGNVSFPSIGLDFELFGVSPVSMFDGAMGTGSFTDPSDPAVVAQGTPLDFATGDIVLAGIQFVPAPIVGNVLQLNKITGRIVPPPVPPLAARTLRRCQATLGKAGARFVKARQKALQQCVSALLACEVSAETGGPAACAAAETCSGALAAIAAADGQLTDVVARGCDDVGGANFLASRGGFNFGLRTPMCSALGLSTASKDGILLCFQRSLACALDEIVARLEPRAHEVLSAAGYAAFLPPAGCTPALAPGDATGTDGAELLGCQGALEKHYRKYGLVKQLLLQKCADGYLACQFRAEREGLAGAALDGCRTGAQRRCEKAVRRITAAADARASRIHRACDGLDTAAIPALAQGLGFASLANHCQALDPPAALGSLDGLLGCLDRSLDCSIEGLVRAVEPRAGEVLTGVSAGGGALTSLYPCLLPRCGDGIVDVGEGCDPLFPVDDSCNPDCTLVTCGDGLTQGSEQCDDGNTQGGDGCSATCTLEPSACGNGVVEPFGGEVCDDGDTAGGDGCDAACLSDETCGNGVVDTIRGEVCDDGGSAFAASLDGAQEVPPVATAATGTATFVLNGDGTLGYSVTTTGLTGTAAHIHAGAVGVDGPILIPLAGGPTVWSGATAPLSPEDLARLKGGTLYVNVHTAANPGGEIRGQIGFTPPVSGDGCSADCRSDETCGTGRIDAGEACDDGNTAGGDGCDGSCTFETCSFFSSGAPLGTRTFSPDPASSKLFNSIVGLGTPVGTAAYTSGPFSLTAGATDASGNAAVTLDSDVVVGITVSLGFFTQCLRFEAVGSVGTLHCCGGHATGMSFTRDSNTGGLPTSGPQANGPAVVLAGVGSGGVGDLEMAFAVSEASAPLATPEDCLTAAYGSPTTRFWTSGTATGRVLRAAQGGTLEFSSAGQAFDCASWTVEDGVGAMISADTALNAVPGVDAANLRILDDQAGD
jgi:cysteine-rich repeat protein